jgi:hypothetical protein
VLILACFSECRSSKDGEDNCHLRHSSELRIVAVNAMASRHAHHEDTLVKPLFVKDTCVSTFSMGTYNLYI